MALVLDFTVKQQTSCTEILFTDLTGDYDATNYPGGWGAPNLARAAVTSSTLAITGPDSVAYTIDITADVVADNIITITHAQIGGTAGTCVPDGQYHMLWTVTDGVTTYTKEIYFFFDCVVACKVAGLFTALDLTNCNPCNETSTAAINNALLAWAYLEALRNSACCGKTANFANILATLERMVDSDQCTSCG